MTNKIVKRDAIAITKVSRAEVSKEVRRDAVTKVVKRGVINKIVREVVNGDSN